MSTQQDIYAAGSENRPPMLNKDNYIPWSSRIIRYARSRPNGKMIVDSIENGPYFRQHAGQVAQNQEGYNAWQNGGVQGVLNGGNQNGLVVVPGIANQSGTGNVVAARAEGDRDEIEEVNANCILIANLQQLSTSGTQHDKAPVYDTDGSAEQLSTSGTQHDKAPVYDTDGSAEYTDLLEPIPEPQLVPQNDNHVTYVAPSMVHSGGTVETSSALNEETPKFVRDFKSLAKEADESLDKQKSLELKIERLLKASVSHDIMSIVERLQAQLRDLKGKSNDTPSALNTLDPLNQKLESKIVELEFQVVNYERKISHLKTTYKNLFNSIKSNRAHAKLHDLIYENAQLRAQGFENTSESMKNTLGMSVTPHVDKPKLSAVTPFSKKLHASMPSHSVPQPREFNENVSSNTVTASSTGLVHTAKTKRPQPKGNTRNARVPSASKSSEVKKNVLALKSQPRMSSVY
nr:ribonuclease H-like domain-containing protein [Tanacetum cinerariifolium]